MPAPQVRKPGCKGCKPRSRSDKWHSQAAAPELVTPWSIDERPGKPRGQAVAETRACASLGMKRKRWDGGTPSGGCYVGRVWGSRVCGGTEQDGAYGNAAVRGAVGTAGLSFNAANPSFGLETHCQAPVSLASVSVAA